MPSVTSNGLRVHYEVKGSGEAVVLLSGLGTDHSVWDLAQVPALIDAGYMCVGIDNRDSGQSDMSPVEEYSIKDMATDVAAVLEALGQRPVHLVGYSMGGMIAQEFALEHPHAVQSLTLCVTACRQSPAIKALINSWEIVRPKCDLRTFWQVVLPWCFGEAFFLEPGAQEAVLDKIEANPYPQPPEAYVRQCRAIATHNSFARLHRIAAPTHVIAGELDLVLPVSNSKLLAEHIPGAQLTILPKVGHAACWENPTSFNEALIGFLERNRIGTQI
jgi:3-oxoadipate enol-lactonase